MTRRLKKLKRLLRGRVFDLYNEQHENEEIEYFIKHRFPFKHHKAISNWPAVKLWRPPFYRLFELIDLSLPIRVAVSSGSFSGINTNYIDMTFIEFLSRPPGQQYSCYMAQCPILGGENLPERTALSRLMLDLRKPKNLPGEEFRINLWMNTGRVVSDFHYDSYQNFLCVISGCKIVELIPPSAFVNTYSIDTESYNHTPDDLEGEFVVKLLAGDVLFIPEGWWHKVTSFEYTVAVNFSWAGIDQQYLATDTSGELDFYIIRNAMKRLVVKKILSDMKLAVSFVKIE